MKKLRGIAVFAALCFILCIQAGASSPAAFSRVPDPVIWSDDIFQNAVYFWEDASGTYSVYAESIFEADYETLRVICTDRDLNPLWAWETTCPWSGYSNSTYVFAFESDYGPKVGIYNLAQVGLAIIDVADGDVDWTLDPSWFAYNGIDSHAVSGDGTMFLGSADASLVTAIDINGAPLWQTDLLCEDDYDAIKGVYRITAHGDSILCYYHGPAAREDFTWLKMSDGTPDESKGGYHAETWTYYFGYEDSSSDAADEQYYYEVYGDMGSLYYETLPYQYVINSDYVIWTDTVGSNVIFANHFFDDVGEYINVTCFDQYQEPVWGWSARYAAIPQVDATYALMCGTADNPKVAIFCSADVGLVQIDAYTGGIEWFMPAEKIGGSILSDYVDGQGNVYFGTSLDPYVTAVSMNGAVLWQSRLTGFMDAYKIEQEGTSLYCYTDGASIDGKYDIIDMRSGELVLYSQDEDVQIEGVSYELEEYIRLELGKWNADLTQSDYDKIKRLEISNQGITSIEGIGYLRNLEYLDLSYNNISDIQPLSELEYLEYLNLAGNRISDIWPIAHMTNIQKLYLGENNIIDIAPLMNLDSLHVLNLYHNQIYDISPLASLINLTDLSVSFNSISDISALEGLHVVNLYLCDNWISDVYPLRNMDELEILDLRGNDIDNYGVLSGLRNTEIRK